MCGRALNFGPLVSGFLVGAGYFPWHAALYQQTSDGTMTYKCGTSLIKDTVLVTGKNQSESSRFTELLRQRSFFLLRNANYSVALGMLFSDWEKNITGVHRSRVSIPPSIFFIFCVWSAKKGPRYIF